MRLRIVLAAVVAALVIVGLASASTPKVIGSVGPGFSISLKDAKGKKVTKLKPGKYAFAISDKAKIHNFHLKGPGIDKDLTAVAFTGKKTVTVTLKKGTYNFYCVPHQLTMHGTFKVG